MSDWARTFRPAAIASIAFVLACGDATLAEETTELGASALEIELVGDRGPGWDAPEEDPTRASTFLLRADDPVIANAPDRVVLNFTWVGQSTGYWCGPGASRIALSTHMADPPSQPALAEFLGTTTDGTARADMIRALNRWLAPPDPYVSIPVDPRPTEAQRGLLKETLIRRLSSGWPVVANVLSGWRPPGYPSGTIGHFVVVMGYEQKGERVFIADPAAEGSAGPRWENVPRTYWISLQNLGTWVGARGYSG